MTVNTIRYALGVEYNGAAFYGWQRQLSPAMPSVQQTLEEALSFVANGPITVNCAGRTDAGVHGSGQVVHFECPVQRNEKAWVMGTNTRLPAEIRVQWAREVPFDFHARHSALARRYRYVMFDEVVKPTVLINQVTHVRERIDVDLMHRAAQCLVGEHDFSAFRATGCQANSPVREVRSVQIRRCGRFVVLEIEANAFLQHMVRNITGTLLKVATGRQPVEWVEQVLQSRDRTQGGDAARPDGLYLVGVKYPEHFGLPVMPYGPCFLPPVLD
ncbi:MAG TPA: tRNA pseudouridine(38-40) synthase TruA [Pseudohongiella sp.]|nr:tRNA pseudouridine(38-40) synthase TruA [Pseudohongiella sp.]